MKVLVTGYNPDKKIQAIKGIRAVAIPMGYGTWLREAKNFIEGDLPAKLTCRSDMNFAAIQETLNNHEVSCQRVPKRGTKHDLYIGDTTPRWHPAAQETEWDHGLSAREVNNRIREAVKANQDGEQIVIVVYSYR